ncbi:alpha/beta fold hydrolase [Streptomyces lavendulae]|uniref:alpha/beta fold hydrolase n=1 Tax=Streptomyces lavendulae TaxID=1914 RepID=UPI00340CB444
MSDKPAIVLVHGFRGGAAHWPKVITELHRRGYDDLHAVENPLTSLADDAERTRKMVRQISAPVVLVGHSYGGAVITEAGTLPNVAGLVYVAALRPTRARARRDQPGAAPGGVREHRPRLRRVPVGAAGEVPRELRAGPDRGRGPDHGRDPEGRPGVHVRGPGRRPGVADEALPVPGVHPGPHDPPGQRTPDGRTDGPPQDDRARRLARLAGLPARPGDGPDRSRRERPGEPLTGPLRGGARSARVSGPAQRGSVRAQAAGWRVQVRRRTGPVRTWSAR